MSNWGVTISGFVRKHLTDVVGDIQAAIKDVFGKDKRVDAKSPIGIILGIVAQVVAEVWEVAEAIYSSFDPDTAVGASLDTLLSITGLKRLGQVYSTAEEVVVGTPGTAIGAGSIIATDPGGAQFRNAVGITLNGGACYSATVGFSEAVTSGHTYSVVINGYSFSAAAGGGSTTDTILAAIAALITAPGSPVRTLVNTQLLGGWPYIAISSATGALFSCDAAATMNVIEVGNVLTFTAIAPGAIPAYAGSLTNIKTPVTGWASAYNPTDASLGDAVEKDSPARQRRATSLAKPGATTVDAIRANLANIPGVTNCSVLNNRTDATDANGLWSHSILIVIMGGADAKIAAEIWKRVGGGDGMNIGNATFTLTTALVTDSQGVLQMVGWVRPTSLTMWVKLTFTRNTEESLPANAAVLMGQSALAIGYTHQPGQDVLPERFHGPVFGSCSGIKTLVVEVSTDGASWQSTPYTVTATQVARFDTTRIRVVGP